VTAPFTPADRLRLDDTLDLSAKTVPVGRPPAPAPLASAPADDGGLDFDLGALDAEPRTVTMPQARVAPAAPAAGADSLLDFGDFDLGGAPAAPVDAAALARKLELAEEFRQIGDVEGARDLLEEVVAKADGALKSKAQGMLDQLARS
jgi:pilus assembly protein FimV